MHSTLQPNSKDIEQGTAPHLVQPDAPSPFQITLCLVGWFALSIVNSTTTKDLLDKFSKPITLTMAQLLTTITYCILTALLKRARKSATPISSGLLFSWRDTLSRAIWYIAVLRLGTKLFHKLALIHVPVSFVHTVKVSSPIFMIIFSRVIIGEVAHPHLIISTFPIIFGVGLCSIAESNFNSYGFVETLLSMIFYVVASILTKKTLEEQQIDKVEFILFSDVATLISMVPMLFIFEGISVLPDLLHLDILYLLLVNGLAQVGQTLFAFYVLVYVTSLSFAVLNVTKRVVVIVGSIIYFGNEINTWNKMGMLIAFGGVFLYIKTKYDLQLKERTKNGDRVDNLKIDVDFG